MIAAFGCGVWSRVDGLSCCDEESFCGDVKAMARLGGRSCCLMMATRRGGVGECSGAFLSVGNGVAASFVLLRLRWCDCF